jgi:hypothetical protein
MEQKDTKKIRENIIQSAYKAIDELIKIAEEEVIKKGDNIDLLGDELTADKLKNAAATKKLAVFDAFEILSRIQSEEANMNGVDLKSKTFSGGFAEKRSKK